jgi:hypothetical protein
MARILPLVLKTDLAGHGGMSIISATQEAQVRPAGAI